MEKLELAFQQYCEKVDLATLSSQLKKPSWVDYILKGRPEDAKQKFREAVKIIATKVNSNMGIDDCVCICEENLLQIKGIGPITVNRYAMHLADLLGINPEANCASFLIEPARIELSKKGWINGKTITVSKTIQDLIKDFSPLVFVDFANNHFSIHLQ